MKKCDAGLVGLAVMGRNLALNMADHGYHTAVYNRSPGRTEEFEKDLKNSGILISPFFDIQAFVQSIKRPRRILLMIKSGSGVDDILKSLLPHLEPGDLVADLGNSHFRDTEEREARLATEGILYAGVGVSGGEEGARTGPSIMPGGPEAARGLIEKLLIDISAEAAGGNGNIYKCCSWLGSGGSGHFVKMVHNGIEYGDMQIISEAYHILAAPKKATFFQFSNAEISEIFRDWNNGLLGGFLNEITSEILLKKDDDGSYLLDRILDAAGQKGTGRWTVEEGFRTGSPVSVISEAVFARSISSMKETRLKAEKMYRQPDSEDFIKLEEAHSIVKDLADALLASRLVSYSQGFSLLGAASREYGWNINPAEAAALWKGGCIIRSRLLDPIEKAFRKNGSLESLLLDDEIAGILDGLQNGWRKTAARAMSWGIPIPGISSALSFFDAFRSGRLPSSLIQAQRDYFGSHTYERTDRPRGEFFHTEWREK